LQPLAEEEALVENQCSQKAEITSEMLMHGLKKNIIKDYSSIVLRSIKKSGRNHLNGMLTNITSIEPRAI